MSEDCDYMYVFIYSDHIFLLQNGARVYLTRYFSLCVRMGTLAEKSKIMNIKKNPLFVSECNEVFFGVTLVVSRR